MSARVPADLPMSYPEADLDLEPVPLVRLLKSCATRLATAVSRLNKTSAIFGPLLVEVNSVPYAAVALVKAALTRRITVEQNPFSQALLKVLPCSLAGLELTACESPITI